MFDCGEAWLTEVPSHFRRPLTDCARGDIPANIAAMQLLMESQDPGEAEKTLSGLLEHLRGQPNAQSHALHAKRLSAALDVLQTNPQAWATVKAVLGDVSHEGAATTPEEQIRRLAGAFDRAAQVSPEGSVALYALGNPDLLKAATTEVVEQMRAWGLLGRSQSVLDLGCGIGRFEEAMAGEVSSIVGIDISGEMIETARRRCAALGNVAFLQSSGRDLSAFAADSFDLVLAVDSFPYLVQSGMSLVQTHVAETARVLKPSGDLLILNFSYRRNPGQDRADIRRLAEGHGFKVLRDGISAFTLWDGLVFHLRVAVPDHRLP